MSIVSRLPDGVRSYAEGVSAHSPGLSRHAGTTLGSRGIKPYNPNGVVSAGAATPMGLLLFVSVDPG